MTFRAERFHWDDDGKFDWHPKVNVEDMIENTTINGRPAVVAYLNDRFQPVDQADATLVKIHYTDKEGGMVFAVAKPELNELMRPRHEAPRSG